MAIPLLLAAGCGVEKDAHYESAGSLRVALVDEGYACSARDGFDYFESEGTSLTCDGGIRVFSWGEEEAGDQEKLEIIAGGDARQPRYYVRSDTWVLATRDEDEAVDLHETFGGELITPDEASGLLSPLQVAFEWCDEGDHMRYDSSYDVLTISGAYRQGSGSFTSPAGREAADIYECVIDEIDLPQHVADDIARTRALDGTRDSSWGDFSASWTYHPDNGINIQIEHAQD
ncbi:hypothetical protein [Nesterenkonia sp. K-15-9-6]|uniref:hypothetical protein n=1 Tax=Nesterenkonia sp. K-15-9-6 TaxID=3093918 RepID=UPI004044B12C